MVEHVEELEADLEIKPLGNAVVLVEVRSVWMKGGSRNCTSFLISVCASDGNGELSGGENAGGVGTA